MAGTTKKRNGRKRRNSKHQASVTTPSSFSNSSTNMPSTPTSDQHSDQSSAEPRLHRSQCVRAYVHRDGYGRWLIQLPHVNILPTSSTREHSNATLYSDKIGTTIGTTIEIFQPTDVSSFPLPKAPTQSQFVSALIKFDFSKATWAYMQEVEYLFECFHLSGDSLFSLGLDSNHRKCQIQVMGVVGPTSVNGDPIEEQEQRKELGGPWLLRSVTFFDDQGVAEQHQAITLGRIYAGGNPTYWIVMLMRSGDNDLFALYASEVDYEELPESDDEDYDSMVHNKEENLFGADHLVFNLGPCKNINLTKPISWKQRLNGTALPKVVRWSSARLREVIH